MSIRTITEEVKVMGDILTPGREFKVGSKNTRDLFIFLRFVKPAKGKGWIEAKGKTKGDFRAFHLDQVAKVVPLPKPRRVKKS